MRKVIRMILVIVAVSIVASTVLAAGITYKGYNVINVVLNGQALTSDVPAINLDGRTMLPVRAIAEAVGADVQWDEATQTVTLTTGAAAPTVPVAPGGAIVEGVRGIVWGSSQATVRATEKARLVPGHTSDTTLYYETTVQGMEVVIAYDFVEDRLIGAIYMFQHDHSNPTEYIDDFKSLKSDLIAKYGKPVIDSQHWKGDLWKSKPNDWGMAVITGDLVYHTIWETPQSSIAVMLSGDNFDARLGIFYDSKDLIRLKDTNSANDL